MTTNCGSSAIAQVATCRPSALAWKSNSPRRQRVALLRQPPQLRRPVRACRGETSPSSCSGCCASSFSSRNGRPDSVVYTSTHPHVRPQPQGTASRRAGAAAPACGRFHARERVAVERQAAAVDVRAAESGARRQQHDGAMAACRARAGPRRRRPCCRRCRPRGDGAPARGTGRWRRPRARRSRRSSRAGSATCRTPRSAGTGPGWRARRRSPGPSPALLVSMPC
jgi:hypothetical protein